MANSPELKHFSIAPRSGMPLIALSLVALCGLAGCGKKPTSVQPPQGYEEDQFPRTYPDPATDPKPDYKP